MSIEELKKTKEKLLLIYNEENKQEKNSVITEELKCIKREIEKIDELINIYKSNNKEYKLMKLERLYMQIMTEKTKKEFGKITIEEENDIFNKVFPNTWSYTFPLETKLKYLEEAIYTNKTINQVSLPSNNNRDKNNE